MKASRLSSSRVSAPHHQMSSSRNSQNHKVDPESPDLRPTGGPEEVLPPNAPLRQNKKLFGKVMKGEPTIRGKMKSLRKKEVFEVPDVRFIF